MNNKLFGWIAILVLVLVAIAAGLWYWQQHRAATAPPPPLPSETTPAPQAQQPAEPAIKYPIAEPSPTATPLPTPGEADGALRDAAGKFADLKRLGEYFFMDDIVHRFVATVDNMPRDAVPMMVRAAKPMPGRFTTAQHGDEITLSDESYKRYTPFVKLISGMNTEALVNAYVHFYPLFQDEYKRLGYPKQYFNDRLVEAIDDLLDAPEPKEPVKLVQPKVVYKFADPDLESLSAGQKMMVRMGPENEAQLKAKLRQIRKAVTANAPPRQ